MKLLCLFIVVFAASVAARCSDGRASPSGTRDKAAAYAACSECFEQGDCVWRLNAGVSDDAEGLDYRVGGQCVDQLLGQGGAFSYYATAASCATKWTGRAFGDEELDDDEDFDVEAQRKALAKFEALKKQQQESEDEEYEGEEFEDDLDTPYMAPPSPVKTKGLEDLDDEDEFSSPQGQTPFSSITRVTSSHDPSDPQTELRKLAEVHNEADKLVFSNVPAPAKIHPVVKELVDVGAITDADNAEEILKDVLSALTGSKDEDLEDLVSSVAGLVSSQYLGDEADNFAVQVRAALKQAGHLASVNEDLFADSLANAVMPYNYA